MINKHLLTLACYYFCAETVLSLMRSPEYCIYGGAKVDNASDLTAGENRFNEVRQVIITRTCVTHYTRGSIGYEI